MISVTEFKNRARAAGHFNVGWVKFLIKFKSVVSHGGDDCLGLTSFDDLEIIVKETKNVLPMRMALLHECWHALLSTVGVKNPDEDETCPLAITNEFITEQCSRASIIATALNPELWDLLTNEEYYE